MTDLRFPRRAAAWWPTLVFTAAAAALTLAAGLVMFSAFMFYDDEGYVLISLRNFAEHGNLYGDVYSQYGPFPFVLHYGLHALGLPFTHTAGRLVTLAAWSGAALGCAALVHRATRSLAATVAVLAAVFTYLWVMASEPSHPGGLIVLLTAALAALGHGYIVANRIRIWGFLAGAIATALLLTKINVGGFVVLAAFAWLLLHHRNDAIRRWTPLVLVAGGVLLPFALMRPLLGTEWIETYAVLFACSAAAAAIAAASPRSGPRAGWSTLGWGALGGVVVAACVLGVMFARGTTLRDFVEGILLGPLKQPASFSLRYSWPAGTRAFALGSAALCALAWLLRRRGIAAVDVTVAIARLAGAVGLAFALAQFPQASPDRFVFAYAAPCLWVFLWPLAGENPTATAARTWVGWLFLGQYLHPFPVAGSQIAWGTFLALPLGVLGAYDAANWLAPRVLRTSESRARALILAFRVSVTSFAMVIGWRFAEVGGRYRGSSDLGLPGAEALRLPNESTALFRILTLNAVAHGELLFSLPGMFSFNLWSGLPTPTQANVTHWFSLLDVSRQEAIIHALASQPRAIVIVQREHLMFLARHGVRPSGPLHDYIDKNFEPAFILDDFEFCVRRGRTIEPLMLATISTRPADSPAEAENTWLNLELILPKHKSIARIEIASDDPAGTPLVLDSSNARLEITAATMRDGAAGGQSVWPLTLKAPATLTVHFDRRGKPRPFRGGLIVLRDDTGAELALARLQQ